MVKPVPSLAARARGALLGHAAGNALGLTARELAEAGNELPFGRFDA